MKTLFFTYRWPGLIEAIARNPDDLRQEIHSEGYRDSGIYDLMMDLDPEDNEPFAFMSPNFDQNYLSVIWGLKTRMANKLFDVPQADLKAVPLYIAFSWAYYHFILEDGKLLPVRELVVYVDPNNFTQVVLAHALQTIAV